MPPLGSVQRTSESAAGVEGGSGLEAGSRGNVDDYQQVMRDENRKAAAAGNDPLTPRNKRPVSANKRFLSKYGLERHGLFAP